MTGIDNQKGFTILELIIASTVFSLIMLLSTTGLIQIGKTYHKGQITSKTQETTRGITEEISREVQYSGDKVEKSHADLDLGADYSASTPGVKIKAKCIGNTRYTYVADTTPNRSKIKLAQSDNYPSTTNPTLKHLLWVDKKLASEPCKAESFSAVNPSQTRELLAQNMRLSSFDITPRGDNVIISIKAYYGDFDLAGANGTGSCDSTKNGGQFCASSELSTVVRRRI